MAGISHEKIRESGETVKVWNCTFVGGSGTVAGATALTDIVIQVEGAELPLALSALTLNDTSVVPLALIEFLKIEPKSGVCVDAVPFATIVELQVALLYKLYW